jgi:L-alanine-DL-glutamate epimerase-like enolase superfamily enzyme
MSESYDKHTRVLEAVRGALGDEMILMVDVQYMWPDAETALETIRDWGDFNLLFLETPVWVDRVDDHAVLHYEAPMPIATGEWFATVHEFETYIDRGCIDVAQPDVGRVGGLLEAKKVCDLAASRGRTIVPHCWKTGISISATAHLGLVTPHCPVIEYLPSELCEERLRRELVAVELELVDGAIRRPQKPGLGIEIDWDALKKYKVA